MYSEYDHVRTNKITVTQHRHPYTPTDTGLNCGNSLGPTGSLPPGCREDIPGGLRTSVSVIERRLSHSGQRKFFCFRHGF